MNNFASPSTTSLSARFAAAIGKLCAMVAARGGREHAVGPLVILICGYLGRLRQRFDRLAARVAAGERQVRADRARADRARTDRVRAGARATDKPRPDVTLPRGWAWLIRFSQPCAQLSEQMEALVHDPAMAAVLAAFPSAGRIFRPLCTALAISPGPTLGCKPAPAPTPGGRRVRKRYYWEATTVSAPLPSWVPVDHTNPIPRNGWGR